MHVTSTPMMNSCPAEKLFQNSVQLFFVLVYLAIHYSVGLISDNAFLGSIPPFKTLEFTSEPSDTVVELGSPALLSCSALYDGGKPSNFAWERNGEMLSPWSQDGR